MSDAAARPGGSVPLSAEWDGRRYGAVNRLQRWSAHRSLRAAELIGNERVLDIGCGDGRVTAELAKQLPDGSVVGIDPSPLMIEAAQVRAGRHLEFRLGNAESLEFDAEFDVALSFNALHWVADQAGAIRRMVRALRPGGWGLVLLVCDGPRRSVEQVAMQVAREPDFAAVFRGFAAPFHHPDPTLFADHVRAVGAILSAQTVDDLDWDFESPGAFREWLRAGFSDWTVRLPDESSRAAFCDAVATRYSDISGSDHAVRFLQLTVRFSRP